MFRRSEPSTPKPQKPPGSGLGTFGGVYTPSILTILGVIMYLRFGWVVGQVGLGGTLLIVTKRSRFKAPSFTTDYFML
ncbi:MAG: hypothetical protein ACOVQ7_08930, partial [Limnoraphis robusta]